MYHDGGFETLLASGQRAPVMLNAEHRTRTGEEGRRRLEDDPTQGYPPVSAEFPGREPSATHPVQLDKCRE